MPVAVLEITGTQVCTLHATGSPCTQTQAAALQLHHPAVVLFSPQITSACRNYVPTGTSGAAGIYPPLFSVKNKPSDDRIVAEKLGPYALRSTIITLEDCNDEAVTLNLLPSATATCAADLAPQPDR